MKSSCCSVYEKCSGYTLSKQMERGITTVWKRRSKRMDWCTNTAGRGKRWRFLSVIYQLQLMCDLGALER